MAHSPASLALTTLRTHNTVAIKMNLIDDILNILFIKKTENKIKYFNNY
jgi:hypothetical protein